MADKKSKDLTTPLVVLVAMYVIGLFGLKFHETQEIFTRLIPLNFLITAGVLLFYQKHWNLKIIAYCFFVFFLTFGIEVVIVQSGIFSTGFKFGKVMGPKFINVPLVMGLMWLIVIYCSGVMVKNLKYHYLLKAALAATMIVMLDVLIEPVAMKLGMWGWSYRRVPLINYMTWFTVSYGLVVLQLNLKANLRNDLAPFVFCIIAAFFLVINLF